MILSGRYNANKPYGKHKIRDPQINFLSTYHHNDNLLSKDCQNKLKIRWNLNFKLINIGPLQTIETAVVIVAKVFALFLRWLFKQGKIKITNSEVLRGVFIKEENKGLFNDGISGKFTINSGVVRGSLSLLYCVVSQVLATVSLENLIQCEF